MKKVFLTTAAIAVALVSFAFSPAEKNDAIENALTLSEAELAVEAGFCDTKYRNQKDFSVCDRTTTAELEFEAQNRVLNKY